MAAKPFAYPELRARIAALLRRTERRPASRLRGIGPVTIDVPGREVRVDNQPVELSAKEYELLPVLSSDPGWVFTREGLLRDVWGFREPVGTRTLDSHAHRLRRKRSSRGEARMVVNVWGVGYRLCDQALLG